MEEKEEGGVSQQPAASMEAKQKRERERKEKERARKREEKEKREVEPRPRKEKDRRRENTLRPTESQCVLFSPLVDEFVIEVPSKWPVLRLDPVTATLLKGDDTKSLKKSNSTVFTLSFLFLILFSFSAFAEILKLWLSEENAQGTILGKLRDIIGLLQKKPCLPPTAVSVIAALIEPIQKVRENEQVQT
jgi:hypothetical protein